MLTALQRRSADVPLAHFRGEGTLLEIRTDDLRFSQDDAGSERD
jgi:ATP/maltotriose-dependent transcriptional regulator MalT